MQGSSIDLEDENKQVYFLQGPENHFFFAAHILSMVSENWLFCLTLTPTNHGGRFNSKQSPYKQRLITNQ